MKKKIFAVLIIIALIAVVGVVTFFKIRDTIRENNFFVVDSIHCTQPTGYGTGVGERYYFAKDNTYFWNCSDNNPMETVVAKSGTWQLSGGKLVLTEKYNLVLENGDIGFVTTSAGEEVEGLIDYEVVLKENKKQSVKSVEYVGISKYSQEMIEEKEDAPICYEYTMDGETWFANAKMEDMPWVDVLKNKLSAEKEATENMETVEEDYESFIKDVRNYVQNLNISGEINTELDISPMFALDIKNYGYMLLDLNADNQNELLFFEISDGYWENVLLDVYTLVNGQIEHILSSDESSMFVLCEDNKILEYCVEDENREYNAYYNIDSDNNLEFIEKVIYEIEEDSTERYIQEDIEGGQKDISMEGAENIYAKYLEKEIYLTSFVDVRE